MKSTTRFLVAVLSLSFLFAAKPAVADAEAKGGITVGQVLNWTSCLALVGTVGFIATKGKTVSAMGNQNMGLALWLSGGSCGVISAGRIAIASSERKAKDMKALAPLLLELGVDPGSLLAGDISRDYRGGLGLDVLRARYLADPRIAASPRSPKSAPSSVPAPAAPAQAGSHGG